MNDEGIEYVGLHSLMPANPGLHLTTPNESVVQRAGISFVGLSICLETWVAV